MENENLMFECRRCKIYFKDIYIRKTNDDLNFNDKLCYVCLRSAYQGYEIEKINKIEKFFDDLEILEELILINSFVHIRETFVRAIKLKIKNKYQLVNL
jgi:hypothetical protein